MKGQAHNSLEPQMEYNQEDTFDESRFNMTFLTTLGITEKLRSSRSVRKTGKGKQKREQIPKSSRLEFLETLLANKFALSDTDDNTSRPIDRGSIADLLLLRTLLEIRQKFQEPGFSEVIRLLFYQQMQVWQLQQPFCNDYQPV